MSEVTQILERIDAGDSRASSELFELVYEELRRIAKSRLARENHPDSLQPTALVHDAYLRMVEHADQVGWKSRGQFFAVAAESMRRILVERARKRFSKKHGGGRHRVRFDEQLTFSDDNDLLIILIHDALDKLAGNSPVKAELVKLRFFAGLTVEEAARALDISRATADRYWSYARAFLYCELEDQQEY